jgi:hypothetical protein
MCVNGDVYPLRARVSVCRSAFIDHGRWSCLVIRSASGFHVWAETVYFRAYEIGDSIPAKSLGLNG